MSQRSHNADAMTALARPPSGAASLLRRFSVLMAGRLAGAAAMFLASLAIARGFGADALAVFALVVSAIGIASVVFGAGYHRLGTILAARYVAQGELPLVAGFLRTGARRIAVGALLAAAGLAGLVATGAWTLTGIDPAVAAVVVAGGAGTAVLYLLSSVMIGLRRQVQAVLPEATLRPLVFLIALALLLLAGITRPLLLVGVYAISIWLAVAAVLLWSWPTWRRVLRAEPAYKRPAWRKAARPWAAISLSWEYLIDAMILAAGLVAAQEDIAVLYVCFRFSVLAAFGLRNILSLFLPDIAAARATGEDAGVAARLKQVNVASALYVAAVVAGFAVAGPMLLGLFGGAFAAGSVALVLVGLALAPVAIFGPVPQILAVHDRHTVSAVVMMGGLAVAVVLTLVVAPVTGVTGPAAVFVLVNTVVYAVLWRILLRRTGRDSSLAAGLPGRRD